MSYYLDIKKASTGVYYLALVECNRTGDRWGVSVSYRITRVLFQGIDPVPTDLPLLAVGQDFKTSAPERVWEDSSDAFRETVRAVFGSGLAAGFAEIPA